jgi:hypothetical protein
MAWPIAGDIRHSVTELFPVRRDRMVVLGLVALAAVVSMTELVATQLFSVLILPKSDRNTAVTALLVVLFLVFFGGLRVINFLREKYRINVFERALVDSGVSKVSDSWRWAMAMEVTSILSTMSRITVVVAATIVLAPLFGGVVVVAVATVGYALSFLYRRQLSTQREFRAAQLAYRSVDNATKVRTRVIAGETGALFGYAGVVVLIGVLLWMILGGVVEPGTGFVLFIALRMLGQTLTEVAKGLMRYVRARAFSEVPSRDSDDEDDV